MSSSASAPPPTPLHMIDLIRKKRDGGSLDAREDYGELRLIALGRVEFEVYRVVFTWRGDALIRIISAQKASKDEREIYYRETFA